MPAGGLLPDDDQAWNVYELPARPTGHDWCSNCASWVRMRADGTMRIHGTAPGRTRLTREEQTRTRCPGSGTNDLTEYLVVAHPRTGKAGTRIYVTGVVQAEMVAGSWAAQKDTVTVFKKIVRD